MDNSQANSPNYSQCTIEELEDVLRNINKEQFPQRYLAAEAMLSKKMQEQIDDQYVQEAPLSKRPRWSEKLLITRISIGLFCVMTLLLIPTMFFNEFMVAKNWTENTTGVMWGVVLIHVLLWLASIKKDKKFSDHLLKNFGGQLSIAIMPLLFIFMSWLFIDKSIPLYLHMLSTQEKVNYRFEYQKVSERKNCKQRLEILDTNELEGSDLCMSESQRNSFPERGKISVFGTRSQFGMMINGFLMP